MAVHSPGDATGVLNVRIEESAGAVSVVASSLQQLCAFHVLSILQTSSSYALAGA